MDLKIAVIVVLCAFSLIQAATAKHVVCYHGTWSTYRHGAGQYGVENIDPFLCTHLIYSFVGVEESGDLRITDPYLDLEENWGRGNMKKFNALKQRNGNLKTLIAVGGWSEGSKKFSIVANDASRRARFVRSSVEFLQKHGFNGLDMDWEYPNQRHELSWNNDKANFITLLKELKAAFNPHGFLLTAAVSAANIDVSYNVPEMSKYLDFINVMAYDLHGSWDAVTGINAPLYARSSESAAERQLNVDAAVRNWLNAGTPRNKLILGVPFYGRTFTLSNTWQTTPGSPHRGAGSGGQYTGEPGLMGYNEICEKMRTEGGWKEEWENEQQVPYAYRDSTWVGFDNPRSIGLKARYAKDNNLGGVMVWSIETDDFHGKCGEKNPLLNEIKRVLN